MGEGAEDNKDVWWEGGSVVEGGEEAEEKEGKKFGNNVAAAAAKLTAQIIQVGHGSSRISRSFGSINNINAIAISG